MTKTLVLLAASAAGAFAQSTVKEAMIKHWKTSGEFTLAVARAMPADGYDFKPNAEQMSYGQLMAHIAGVNQNACANASGLDRPALTGKIGEWAKDTLKVSVDRDTAIGFLESSFAFCDRAVAAMTAERFDNVVGPANRKLTGFEWLWGYFTHTAHHRGQAEVYLRVKGIKPPEYTF